MSLQYSRAPIFSVQILVSIIARVRPVRHVTYTYLHIFVQYSHVFIALVFQATQNVFTTGNRIFSCTKSRSMAKISLGHVFEVHRQCPREI